MVEELTTNTYPRLERIVELTLKLHQGEEDTDDKAGAKKGGKPGPPPPAKKDDKKNAKKGGKNAADETEDKKELTFYEKQHKEAVNLEKAIFRYRVQVIKDSALIKL